MRHRPAAGGFTIVEMAVVMLIIGLLAGGIVAARNLIRNSQVQSVVTQMQGYVTAIGLFQQKYNALPGDMPDAETYWGSDAGCSATPANLVPKKATCNGTGNGQIAGYEVFRSWQHLADATLIEGIFTGVEGTAAANQPVFGVNLPASKIDGAGFYLNYKGTLTAANGTIFAAQYGHTIDFGSENDTLSLTPILTPEEAWGIDTKIDDAKPAYGKVMAHQSTSAVAPNCATSAATTAGYKLTDTSPACNLIFITGF